MVSKKKATKKPTKKNICDNPQACHDIDCYDCGCRPFPRGKPKKKLSEKSVKHVKTIGGCIDTDRNSDINFYARR
jgi:hypothetical protein